MHVMMALDEFCVKTFPSCHLVRDDIIKQTKKKSLVIIIVNCKKSLVHLVVKQFPSEFEANSNYIFEHKS